MGTVTKQVIFVIPSCHSELWYALLFCNFVRELRQAVAWTLTVKVLSR